MARFIIQRPARSEERGRQTEEHQLARTVFAEVEFEQALGSAFVPQRVHLDPRIVQNRGQLRIRHRQPREPQPLLADPAEQIAIPREIGPRLVLQFPARDLDLRPPQVARQTSDLSAFGGQRAAFDEKLHKFWMCTPGGEMNAMARTVTASPIALAAMLERLPGDRLD
jgi:hypothetical protein